MRFNTKVMQVRRQRNAQTSLKLMGTASALVLSFCMTQPAKAQVADADEEDNPNAADQAAQEQGENLITVTGIRQRIESAQNIKREADTFVDAITAEDIGAFPDRSVNESLQRIPGVTINRFQASDDPDHFSIEGSNVVIRGLPFVRSEFNGRTAFSVDTGRSLGFNDVSPELLGSVLVYKNATADQIEGAISGLVDLRTRKPLDSQGLTVAGTIETNYGNVRESFRPAGSILVSNVFDSDVGNFGVQLSYSYNEQASTAFGSALSDYRARPDLTGPSEDLRYVPRSASVRSQNFDRDRQTFDAVLQWEATDGSALVTAEYIRTDSGLYWGERTLEGDVFDQGADPNPEAGTDFVFDDDGLLLSGSLDAGGAIPIVIGDRQRRTDNVNEDFSVNLQLKPTDRLTFTFDGQFARATSQDTDVTLFGSIDSNIIPTIDRTTGEIPSITFAGPGGDQAILADPDAVFYRAVLDHVEDSEGDEFAFRADVDYEFDGGFLRSLKAGGRYSDRNQERRFSGYTWGYVSQPWTGAGIAPYADQPSVGNIDSFAFPDFQRGEAPIPASTLYAGGGLDLTRIYRSGEFQRLIEQVERPGCCGGKEFLIERGGRVDLNGNGVLDPDEFYLPSEINDSREETWAAYARADFELEDLFGVGTLINGNIGVRYVNTVFQTAGAVGSNPILFTPPGDTGQVPVTLDNVGAFCANVMPDPTGRIPTVCTLDAVQQADFLAITNAPAEGVRRRNSYDYFLPSLNLNVLLTDDLITRFAVSRAISRPSFGTTAFAATLFGNDAATAANGEPLFQTFTGTSDLEAVLSTNFDFGIEWYFNPRGGSLTFNAFYKLLDDVVTQGAQIQQFTLGGVTTDVLVNGPVNAGSGEVYGFEVGYAQFFDFLPGALSGLGIEGNYTYLETSDFPAQVDVPAFADPVNNPDVRFAGFSYPLQEVSNHAFNIALLYEKYGFSGRVAYNWRDTFLLTPRDVIRPNSPLFHAPTGNLDASLFYAINDNIKVGVQAANLLNEVVETRQQTAFFTGAFDADGQPVNELGPVAPRSFFSNDTRYTFSLRFNF